MKQILVAVLAVAFLSSCAFRMGDLQIISSKNVKVDPKPLKSNVEGKDCVHWALGIIPITGVVPNVEEAMDQAMEKVPEGNVLTDVAIYNDAFWAILFTQNCLRVKGDVGVLQ